MSALPSKIIIKSSRQKSRERLHSYGKRRESIYTSVTPLSDSETEVRVLSYRQHNAPKGIRQSGLDTRHKSDIIDEQQAHKDIVRYNPFWSLAHTNLRLNIDGSAPVGLPISLFWYMPEVRCKSSVELRPRRVQVYNKLLYKRAFSEKRSTFHTLCVCVFDSMRYKNSTTYR